MIRFPSIPRLPLPPEQASYYEAELKQALKKQLLQLSYHAFATCMKHLLTAMGYKEVQLLGRVHRRGRTKQGGADLAAASHTGVTSSQVLLQIKQYSRPVSRRFVDELRGACLRIKAEQAMLFTTSVFSPAAIRAASREHPTPIRLVDGEELLDLLITHRIGVREAGSDQLLIDDIFFATLHQNYPAKTKQLRFFRRVATGAWSNKSENKSQRKSLEDPFGPPGRNGGELTWRTHALFGMSSLWLMEPLLHSPSSSNIGVLAAVAAFGALLPDLDAAESKVKSLNIGAIRPFAPLSYIFYHAWGHRGPLHSLLGLLLVGIVATTFSSLTGWQLSLALFLGYTSHLAADACTKTGIPLFYPNKSRYFLLPPPLRFTTGSQAEDMLLPILAAVVILLILSNFPQP